VGVTYGQMRSIKGRSRGHAGLFIVMVNVVGCCHLSVNMCDWRVAGWLDGSVFFFITVNKLYILYE
jgi:hypothetical protein